MNKDALLLFCGLFWAGILGSASRYRPFDTATAFYAQGEDRRRARSRFLWSIIILDVAPIFWFWYWFSQATNEDTSSVSLIAAAVVSLSLFGFLRVLHAVLASNMWHARFYSDEQWGKILEGSGHPAESAQNEFRAHFIPGVAFLIVPPLIALLLRLGY